MSGKRRSREETRAALIDAASKQFAMYGLEGASTTTIADDAGVSVSMINHHFGGKLGLYQACVRGFGEARLERLRKYLVAPSSAEEFEVRLELMVTDLLELHVEQFEQVLIVLRDINTPNMVDPEIEDVLFNFTLTLGQFFALGAEAGYLRESVDPLTAASVLYLSLSALLQVDPHRERVSGQSLRDPEHRAAVVKNLVDLVLRGALR